MNGDNEKIERLYRYRPAVIAYLKRCGFSSDELQDLTQDVYARVSEKVTGYRGEADWTFLMKVARTVALNEIRDRHAKKRNAVLVSQDDALEVSGNELPPDDAVAAKLRRQRLQEAVQELEPTYRTAMLLYLAELSYEEIAMTLGTTVSAVKSRLHEARQKLTQIMTKKVGSGGEQ